jgi:hypothetical protein
LHSVRISLSQTTQRDNETPADIAAALDMDVGALIDFSKAVGPKLFRTLRKNSLLKIGTLLIVQRKVPVIEAQAEQEAEAHGEETQQKSKPGESKVDKVGKVEEEKPTGVREGEDGVGAVGEEAETAPAPASEASKAMEVDEGEGAAAKVGSAGDDGPLPAVLTGAWIEERGWTAEMRTRRGGSTQGMTDKYWTPPAKTEVPAGFQGQRTGFRSLPEVRRFLAAVDDYEEEGGDDGSDEGEEDGDGDEEGERDEEMAAEVAADGGAGADAAFEDGTDATEDAAGTGELSTLTRGPPSTTAGPAGAVGATAAARRPVATDCGTGHVTQMDGVVTL